MRRSTAGAARRFASRERAGAGLDGFFQQLGLVPRSDFEELELRVAQLEHRLRLVEGEASSSLGALTAALAADGEAERVPLTPQGQLEHTRYMRRLKRALELLCVLVFFADGPALGDRHRDRREPDRALRLSGRTACGLVALRLRRSAGHRNHDSGRDRFARDQVAATPAFEGEPLPEGRAWWARWKPKPVEVESLSEGESLPEDRALWFPWKPGESARCSASAPRPSPWVHSSEGVNRASSLRMEHFRLMAQAPPKTRNLGRLTEIAQVAVRHGFGYFFERHKLTDLLPGRRNGTELLEGTASERGKHLRELLDELGPTFVKFGQLLSMRPDVLPPDIIAELRGLQDDVRPFPYEEVERVDPRRPRSPDRAPLPRVRPRADRGGLDRPGAPRRAPERPRRRGQGPAPRRAGADRGRPRSPLPGRAHREGARPGARLRGRARGRRRVRPRDPPGARLPPRGAERRDALHRNFAGHPHVRVPRVYWTLHARTRPDARVHRGLASSPTSTRPSTRSRSGNASRR